MESSDSNHKKKGGSGGGGGKEQRGYSHLDQRASSGDDADDSSSRRSQPRTKKGALFGGGKKKEKQSRTGDKSRRSNSPQIQRTSIGNNNNANASSIGDGANEMNLSPAAPPPRFVFGVPLAEALANNRSHDGVPLPAIVRQCIDYVNDYGLELEGIYRVSAPKSRLDELERLANVASDTIHFNDAHDAAGLLKRFLRQLPEHVLTSRLRDSFERAAAECPCPMFVSCTCLTGDRLKALLRQLPACNYTLVAYIFRHAQDIEHSNKMSLAALGLLLQATLNMSQNLLRILLMNASSQYARHLPANMAATYLFDDVEIKRYVIPQRAELLRDNLPAHRRDIEDELHKQQSVLGDLHEQVARMRQYDHHHLSDTTEQQLWDVQMVITLLKRKLKCIKQNDTTTNTTTDGPTVEMFEEKQLLAAHMELKEQMAVEKRAIVQLLDQHHSTALYSDATTDDDSDGDDDRDWKMQCADEEQRRSRLLAEIIDERCRCARLRAELELFAVTNLRDGSSLVTRF